MRIFNLFVLVYLVVISTLGIFYKHISFGWGLGDMFGYILLIGGTILHTIISLKISGKDNLTHGIVAFMFLIFSVLISLQATLWRGHEYPWNGSLFYLPCPEKIKVIQKSSEKEVLISSCRMSYHSEFSGKWNGREIEIVEGGIEIHPKLLKYVDYPIDKVLIQSDSARTRFNVDTFQVDKVYDFSGGVIQIIDGKPLIDAYH